MLAQHCQSLFQDSMAHSGNRMRLEEVRQIYHKLQSQERVSPSSHE
jgi:hypothetical protein